MAVILGLHFQHYHCAVTDSAELTGQEGTMFTSTYLPRSHLSYSLHSDMIWQSISHPITKQDLSIPNAENQSVHDVNMGLTSTVRHVSVNTEV